MTLDVLAKPGTGAQVLATFRELLPDTRQKEGFEEIVAHVDQDNADRIMLYERWRDRAAHESYLAWRTERGDLEALTAMLAEPPVVRWYDTADA